MIIYTDNIEYAENILGQKALKWKNDLSTINHEIEPVAKELLNNKAVYCSLSDTPMSWQYMLITGSAVRSQYDLLVDMCRDNIRLPHGILCIAGEGRNFHGFKNRSWSAPAGNIYLSVFLAPCRPVENFGVGFTILAAVSAVDAIDSVPGLHAKAGIKWVNDVLIDGAKVCGVLAQTQAEGDIITGAVLGIGLNVEATPEVKPTPFVPKVASLKEFACQTDKCNQHHVLEELIKALDKNYSILINNGYRILLDKYRRRSLVTGCYVEIRPDDMKSEQNITIEGKVIRIGENLELVIKGIKKPVTKGRLIIKNQNSS